MTVKTHIVSSVSLALMIPIIIQKYIDPQFSIFEFSQLDIIIYLCAVVFGSMFPDIDEPESFIGKRSLFLSNFISIFVQHRGITHTLFILFIYIAIAFFIVPDNIKESGFIEFVVLGFIVGNIGHMLGDMLADTGVMVFFPLYQEKVGLLPSFARFSTGGIIENILVFPGFFFLFLYISYNFYILPLL